MKKTFCDICGKEINIWKTGFEFPLEHESGYSEALTDICHGCHSELNNFILNKRKENKC